METESVTKDIPFWKAKTLEEMTKKEWESLCDSCGKCCLEKILLKNGEVKTLDTGCIMLDRKTLRCKEYKNRFLYVSDCIKLTPTLVKKFTWLPSTCSYRLVFEGKDLPNWHPLITNDKDSTLKSGNSAKVKSFVDYL